MNKRSKFIDTDELIVSKINMPIKDYINNYGIYSYICAETKTYFPVDCSIFFGNFDGRGRKNKSAGIAI